jgi:hypothetical protein
VRERPPALVYALGRLGHPSAAHVCPNDPDCCGSRPVSRNGPSTLQNITENQGKSGLGLQAQQEAVQRFMKADDDVCSGS